MDAKFVLCDSGIKKQIRQAYLQHESDCPPWEELDVAGWPVTTIARGRVVYEYG